ncbi:hypothetical protein [Microcoleus sp. B3-D7]|uniref:hypothetical protein n=1 Tax=Microcoleus sp. B3-D7 TaxID=2818659 RepID=UPI002FD05565
MNIAELYQLTPQSTSFKLEDFVTHIDEFADSSSYVDHTGIINDKIETKVIWRQNDHIRYWQLATVWFDGKPFAVIQNGGFNRVEHKKVFWTDLSLYTQAVLYLRSIFPIEQLPELTNVNFDAPELLKFHKFSFGEK